MYKKSRQTAGTFLFYAKMETTKRVAIQGIKASFHEEAAYKFFGKNIETVECNSFKETCDKLEKNDADFVVMAIENSIAGSILPNYSLLQKSNLRVVGEIYLQIRQNLLVNQDVQLEDIREVHSHPMAIQQCLEYLDKYDWKLVETEDTALSAKHIHQHRSKHIAAIASKLAADLFSLKVIGPNIHTMKNNYTRFLVVRREEFAQDIADANKASVNFHTDHSRGSLAKVLTVIAQGGINLSKLQSFPIPGSDWQYSFHADMEFDGVEQFNEVLKAMEKLTEGLKVYGVYKKGVTV